MTALDSLARALEPLGTLKRGEALSRHTTFGIGGPADLFLTVRDVDALARAAIAGHEAGLGVFLLGSGSNILVADGGIRGLVIDNRARDEAHDPDGHTWRVGSGASFAAFSRRMCREGRSGMAWAVGIPGTFGGAVVYNAGAYGGCLADVLLRVRIWDPRDGDRWMRADELAMVYRASLLTRDRLAGRTVLETEIRLGDGDPRALLAEAGANDGKRLTAQPRGRNAGSMFKNPASSAAWKLIDAVGLRGAACGDAAISALHCNFFVNNGLARAADVASLVTEAERRVHDQFGITLEREVAFVGEW
jgi:UDP-N-acetylmuramate dehydrogenase